MEDQIMDTLGNAPDPAIGSFNTFVNNIKLEVGKIIVGQEQMADLFLAALFTGGHVLVEGVPGIAKTLFSKLLAQTLSVDFSRIQFTPDLMPSDVLGTSVFNMQTATFNFKQGPIFSNLVLIDEINRSPAKTQAALFEVMEEKQVTVDGQTKAMEEPFMVIATQNPIEQEGTYKLPEAQLDRFLFRIKLTYPSLDEEKTILKRFREDFNVKQLDQVQAVINPTEIAQCRSVVEKIHISDELLDYIATIVDYTRNHGDLYLGASPRASLAIMKASKALAAMAGRNFVTPDDINFATKPVLNHRVLLAPEKEMEGHEPEDVIDAIVKEIEIPR